jgi:4-amino-4-deoxy-L-arabinose transferase-like glycosyltransferase
MKSAASDSRSPRPTAYDDLFSDYRFHIALLAVFSIVLIFSKLGGSGLANYDDCFYAQKAKEILQTKSWMTIHWNNKPSFPNPPFYLWLAALSYKIFGVGEYAAKFPSALMGVSTILLLYFFARYLFDPWMGFLSSLVLSTTFMFTRYARHAMFDVTLSFFVCLAMFALVLSLRKNGRYYLLWGVSISIAVLTKSVLGLFPLVITVLYLLIIGRWKTFFSGYFLAGCGIIVLLGFSWYFHQYRTFGQHFLDAHFGELIIRRGLLSEPEPWHRHLSYLRVILINYWPWLPFLVLGFVKFCKMAWRKDENAILILLWLVTILATLSMMKARIRWYILPIFPAAAMLSGHALHGLLTGRRKVIFSKVALAIGIVATIGINATPLPVSKERKRDVRTIAPYVRHFGDRGANIVAFRQNFNSLNFSLLFYSDYAASPVFRDYSKLSDALADSALVLCLLKTSELEGALQNINGIHVVRRTDKLALVSNQAVDISAVKTW